MVERLKRWAGTVRRDTVALWLAARDSRTPLAAKFVAAIVVAYALSPIDLIPDFIPVLGYLDDLILLPLGIVLAVSLIPDALMAEFRAQADGLSRRPANKLAGAVILTLWLVAAAVAGLWTWRQIRPDL